MASGSEAPGASHREEPRRSGSLRIISMRYFDICRFDRDEFEEPVAKCDVKRLRRSGCARPCGV